MYICIHRSFTGADQAARIPTQVAAVIDGILIYRNHIKMI